MKRLPSRERLPSHLLQKSGSKQKPSLFGRSFMLNFSIVIILSILLGIIVLSVQMHSSMKRKEMEALASTLRTGVEQVDDQISNVTDSLLSLRDELSSSGKRFIGRYDANTLNDTQNRLHTIVSHNSLIDEIVLVYEDTDLVVTSRSVCPSVESFFFYYDAPGLDANLIRNYTSKIRPALRQFIPCSGIGRRDAPTEPTLFCYTLPLDDTNFTARRGVAYIFFSQNEIMDIAISDTARPYASLKVTSNASGSDCTLFESTAEKGGDSGFSMKASGANGLLNFQVTMDQQYLSDALQSVNHTTIIVILLSVFVGAILAILSAYQQDLPWRAVMHQLSDHGLLMADNKNAYAALTNSLDRLIADRETASGQLAHYQESLENNMLDRLFSSSPLRAEDAKSLQMDLGAFPEQSVVYYGKILISSAESSSSMELATMVILEFLRQHLPENIILHSTDLNTFGLVYPLDGSTEEEITQSLQALLNEVPQHFAAQVLAAPGGLCTSINTVGLLFEHGQMNYYASVENHTPGEPILHPETTDDDEQLRLRSLLLLHQHLAAGDAENAVAALETFYACPLDAQLIDLRERYSTLKTQILLSAREAAPQCQVPPLPWFSCFGSDPTKPLLALTDAARAVADAVAKQQSTDVQDDQCRRLMEYLQKNYADSSLCATVMADEFRVSEKYLFTLFKKKTGHSPIRYLHSIRMKRAAELLCEDKMTVQQVCEAVGIPNLGTFQKAFKREYGVAPSRYREYALRSSR